jgi:hypothetical protein
VKNRKVKITEEKGRYGCSLDVVDLFYRVVSNVAGKFTGVC